MVKQGYKQTEIGVIPEDWEVKSVKDLTSFHKQGYYTKEQYKTNGAYYLLRGTDMQNPKIDLTTTPRLDVSDNDFISYKVLKNDVLIVRSGAIGRYGINKEENSNFIFGSYLINFRFKNELVPEYFGCFYESDYSLSQIKAITQGGANLNINAENIKSLQIPLPPLAEQEAIASALSDADAWIDSLEQLIAKKRLIKQGAMQTLLTPQEDWEVKKLGEMLINVIDNRGKTPPCYKTEKHELIETASVSFVDKNVDYSKVVKYVDDYTFKNWFRGHPLKGDLLVSTVGEYSGATALYFMNKGTIAQNLIAIRLDNNLINSEYLLYWSKSNFYKIQLKRVMMHQAQPSLKVPWLLSFEISFPSLSEQERIATILSDMDAELEALETQLGKSRQIKQGMMQELLTGCVRLV